MQPSLQGAHWPVATCPYWPLGQKAEQRPPRRKGKLVGMGRHEVQVGAGAAPCNALAGCRHVAQSAWQGSQYRVAFAAKPIGHALTHRPRCMNGKAPLSSHVRQLSGPAPSQVRHDGWHGAHWRVEVTYDVLEHVSVQLRSVRPPSGITERK